MIISIRFNKTIISYLIRHFIKLSHFYPKYSTLQQWTLATPTVVRFQIQFFILAYTNECITFYISSYLLLNVCSFIIVLAIFYTNNYCSIVSVLPTLKYY